MLKNARVTAFTVSELLRENQRGRGVKLPPPPPPHTHTLRLGLRRQSRSTDVNHCILSIVYPEVTGLL